METFNVSCQWNFVIFGLVLDMKDLGMYQMVIAKKKFLKMEYKKIHYLWK